MKLNESKKGLDDKLFKFFLLFVLVVLSVAIFLSISQFANGQTDETSEILVVSETIESNQDPGIGHQTHQLAMILPLAEGIWYNGTLTFEASEPIQIYELVGPLGDDEFTGQPVWTPDGITMYGLHLEDLEESSGTWNFSANALALHTTNTEPFTVLYTVEYAQHTDTTAPTENMDETEDVEETEDIDTSMENINSTEDIEVVEETEVAEEPENIEEKEIIPSPRQQIKSGISPNEVVCKDGLGLIFKASNNQPACVLQSTAIVLIERGWADTETI